MVEYLGDKTGAWMTTITYDAATITPENLKQYDAIFLDSSTGEFLDDPNDRHCQVLQERTEQPYELVAGRQVFLQAHP